jgi:3-hydroxyacyl-CoA dehydrogenase / enoyl-CoA hydratase / 3-hydroxybutyryl-CoA epimerase
MSNTWSMEMDAERIAWVVCDAPGASTNVLSSGVLREFGECLSRIAALRPAGVVVRSAKAGGFIAGADIKEFLTLRSPEEGQALTRAGQLVFQQLADLPCPSVAAIHGFALGGGLELALACTYRVGADDSHLSLGLPEVLLGIHPGFGGTVRSVQLIGVRPALDLMLKGKPLNGAGALGVGLIDRLVPPAELLQAAKSLLAERPPRKAAPPLERLLNLRPLRPFVARQAVAALQLKVPKEHYPAPYAIVQLWSRYGGSGARAYQAETRSMGELMCSPSSRNLVRVFLLQDRLKALGGKSQVSFKHVHVIGAGVMGGDIAAWSAFRGMTVTLQDRSEDLISPALERAGILFRKLLKDPAAAAAALGRLRTDVAGDGVPDADVIIEAIFENIEAKRSLYAQLEPRMKPGAILATNTSSIKIETLCANLADPTRLVGIHFFNPVAQMQLVEIVRGGDTQSEVAQNAQSFTRKLGKLPLPCRSAPGFVVNRILMPYLNEAMFAYEEGISAAVIDRAGKHFGMPMGPLELADVVGLDVALNVGRVLGEAFHRRVPRILVTLVEEKSRLGKKNGEGFYVWNKGKPVQVEDSNTAPPDLEDRLILPMLNEAVAALREGVIADADLLDAGVIFATGFAPFRGGPLQYARSRGVGLIRQRLEELEKSHGERFRPDPGWDELSSV